MKHTLRVEDLYIRRSSTFCLRIERLKLHAGTILCIAGPNGSGKTTLIECLVGLLTPSTGSIIVSGQAMNKYLRHTKAITGFVPDDDGWFVKELCAKEYFSLLQSIYHEAGADNLLMKARIREFARMLHFTAFEQPLEHLSHGNKKKVQIIAGLMHRPKVIILDELRNGLDPLAIIAAETIIRREAEQGACVVAATHDLWWAERIASETMLLIDGSVAVHQKTQTLIARYGSLEKLFMQTMEERGGTHAAV